MLDRHFAIRPRRVLLASLGFGVFAVAVLPAAEPAFELGLPFADNAVFQQQTPVPVWVTARPGATVTVTFGAQTKTANINPNGKWRVTLDPLPADKLAAGFQPLSQGRTSSLAVQQLRLQTITP